MNLLTRTKTVLNYVFLMACCLMPQVLMAQNQNISLQGTYKMSAAIAEIEKQTKMSVDYDESVIDLNKELQLNISNKKITDVMPQVLAGSGATYTIKGDHVVITKAATTVAAKSEAITVTGKITDSKGETLPSVNVIIKGTTTGVFADLDGNYSITIPASIKNPTLRFAFMGYTDQEQVVGNRNEINATMVDDISKLDEVVVVGFGSQKKASLTGAISAISSKDIARTSATTTSGALVGKIAGINSRMSDGRPGAGTSINIRNMGNPLYVIDGVQTDEGQFNNIDFNDVESISVLKDGSAAIYGVRAANGVIVVKTKSGKRNAENVINVNSYYGIQSMFKFPEPADAGLYVRSMYQSDVINKAADANHTMKYTYDEVQKWEQGTEKNYRGFDWYDYILTTSPQTYLGVNTSGGSDKINYYIALAHLSQDAAIKGYGGFTRTNLQFNTDANITAKLKVGASVNGRIETRKHPGVPGGDDTWQALFSIYRNQPTKRPFANDNPLYPAQTSSDAGSNFGMLNYDMAGNYEEKWQVMQLNFNADYEITKDLTVKGIVGYYIGNKIMNNHEYTYKLYDYTEATDTYNTVFSMDNPWRERGGRTVTEMTSQLQVNYKKQFNEKHNFNMMFGAESSKRDNPEYWLHDRPASNSLSLIYQSTLDEFRDDGKRTEARVGFVSRLNYDYEGKYLFEVAARYDGSWKFPPSKRWGIFPSFSGGWRMSEETFWKESGVGRVFTNFKLRASYGILGDDSEYKINDRAVYNPFDYLGGYSYNAGGAVIDGKWVIGSEPRGLPVTNLSWMKAKILDVGIDFEFFGGKLSGTLDYFRRTKDGIPASKVDVLLPPEVGFVAPNENLNSEIHRGFDGGLMWKSSVKEVSYNIGANFTFARQLDWHQYKPRFGNSLEEYYGSRNERYAYVGWGLKTLGQFQSWEQIADYTVDVDRQGNKTLRPGDLIYEDINGDGIINGNDTRPIGFREGGLPYLNYAINLGAAYKGFDIAVDFTGSAFASYTMDWESRIPFHNSANNPAYYMNDQWRLSDINDANSPLIPGKYPTLIEGRNGHSNYWRSDFWTKNVRYLKLKNIEIGYTAPTEWTQKFKIKKVRIYTSMQNVWSFDNLGKADIDPEITGGSGVQYPTNRVTNFGINITF